MHFQIIEDPYFKLIPEKITLFVPGFDNPFDLEDNPYLHLGALFNFLLEHSQNEDLLNQTSAFLNEALSTGGSKTEDAIVQQIFEPSFDYPHFTEKWPKLLKGRASDLFLEYLPQ